jgi:hypothetical protein
VLSPLSNPYAAYLASQYQAARLAQQTAYLQALGEARRQMAVQYTETLAARSTQRDDRGARDDARRQRRRERNAERAFQSGEKAEAANQLARAKSQYRRAVRISPDSDAGRMATESLARIESIRLASIR